MVNREARFSLYAPFRSREINSIRYQGNNNSGRRNDNSWCFLSNDRLALFGWSAQKQLSQWEVNDLVISNFWLFPIQPRRMNLFSHMRLPIRRRHKRASPPSCFSIQEDCRSRFRRVVACPSRAPEIAVSSVVYRDVAIGHLLRSGISWSISSGEIATLGIRTYRRGFMEGLQSQDTVKRPCGEREREREW